MRWIVIGFIGFQVGILLTNLAKYMWRRDGLGVIVAIPLLAWALIALHGSI